MSDLNCGTQVRDAGYGVTTTSILCPECREDFFQLEGDHFTLKHCPTCGWPKPAEEETVPRD